MNIAKDIKEMHQKFGVNEWVDDASTENLKELMRLRMMMLGEEYAETNKAFLSRDKEELIDGLIDIIVIAVGTLDIVGVDAQEAWNQVHSANVSKEVGVKEGRPNPLGLPDLVKPSDWIAPDHSDNYGELRFFL